MIITRRIQAVLSALAVALWVGFGSVSANDSVVPSKDICITSEIKNGTKVSMNVVERWYSLLYNYDERNMPGNPNVTPPYTLDQFHSDLNRWLTTPEMINCYAPMSYIGNFPIHWTFVHALAEYGGVASNDAAIEAAKWAISKGYDLNLKVITLSYNPDKIKIPAMENKNAYEIANAGLKRLEKQKYNFKRVEGINSVELSPGERYIVYGKLAEILNPTHPRPATKTCAEVDGQTPPANEYCIIAENVQSSRRIAITGTEKQFAGGSDYKYEAHRALSGTGLFPGWKAVITFTCSSRAESDCGYADYVLPSDLTPEQIALLKPVFKVRWGLNVHCGESADLLGLDRDLEPGESVSVTHASDTERSSPWHMDCRANALDPFTLTVKTTRLAQ